jgi:hypothetical protein
MSHLAQSKIPFIYNFSQAVVPKPLDWGDATTVSGYWFLDNPDPNWTPPEALLHFMDAAKKDKKPLVYIGFGSITVPDPAAVTTAIVQAVLKSGLNTCALHSVLIATIRRWCARDHLQRLVREDVEGHICGAHDSRRMFRRTSNYIVIAVRRVFISVSF